MFLCYETIKGIHKIYSLTSAKFEPKYLRGLNDRVSSLPKPCLFSLGRDGCVLLNNPFFVPNEYITKINISLPPKGEQNRYDRYKRQIFFIENNLTLFEEAVKNLWSENTNDDTILFAQKKCINLTFAWNYAANEKTHLQISEKNKLIEETLTKIYDDMDRISEMELSAVDEIKNAQSLIDTAIVNLAETNNIQVDFEHYNRDEILDKIEETLKESKSQNKELKSQQGIK
jgi:hypothetical protein